MIKAAGHNECNQLCLESNNKGIYNTRVISPPLKLPFEISKLLSFSVYYLHSVWVTTEGKGYTIGSNRDFRICRSISNEIYRKATEIEIRDNEGNPRKLLSAVCGLYYTLYMVQPPVSGGSPELAYVYHEVNNDTPLFLNINGRKPISLFGGEEISAVIDSEGDVIIITSSACQILNLPNGLKAVSIAFCDQSVFALSSCNRLFESTHSKSKNKFSKFYEVSEFRKIEVIQIAGTFEHCLVVCADGSVFGRGSNDYGKLGLGNKIERVDKFTKISPLKNVVVKSAYAGSGHSLFQTNDGKVFACGKNNNGELMLRCGPSKEDCFVPALSLLDEKVSFCIAGSGLSVIFIGEELPPLIPNIRSDDKRRMIRQAHSPSSPSPTSATSPAAALKTPHSKHRKEPPSISPSISPSPSGESKHKDEKKDTKKDLHSTAAAVDSTAPKVKDEKRETADETENLIRQIEELRKANENLQKKLQSTSKQLKTARENETAFKKRITSLEEELEQEKQKNRKLPQPSPSSFTSPTATKFIDADSIRGLKRIKEIGRGATSEVVKVLKTEEFALKIINVDFKVTKGRSDDDDDDSDDSDDQTVDVNKIRHFFNEYEIISQINHPNVIKSYGFFVGDRLNKPSILLEFCPFNLSKCVKKLSGSEKVVVLYEICEAMKCVHSLGIIHRDLKPENILLDSMKHVRVSDFGIAKLMTPEMQTQSMTNGVGTLKFMAPELLRESGKYSEKVDVYAFGVLAFFVLTNGEFPKISVVEIGNGKMAKIPDFVNDFAKKLIKRCWAMVPEDRPSFAEIIELIRKNRFGLIDGIRIDEIHLLNYD